MLSKAIARLTALEHRDRMLLVGRRRFIQLGIQLTVSLAPCLSLAKTFKEAPRERFLSFYNTHTAESLKAVHWTGGRYLSEGMDRINFILRDHRTNEVKSIDPHLLDLLYALLNKLGTFKPFHVISVIDLRPPMFFFVSEVLMWPRAACTCSGKRSIFACPVSSWIFFVMRQSV